MWGGGRERERDLYRSSKIILQLEELKDISLSSGFMTPCPETEALGFKGQQREP